MWAAALQALRNVWLEAGRPAAGAAALVDHANYRHRALRRMIKAAGISQASRRCRHGDHRAPLRALVRRRRLATDPAHGGGGSGRPARAAREAGRPERAHRGGGVIESLQNHYIDTV